MHCKQWVCWISEVDQRKSLSCHLKRFVSLDLLLLLLLKIMSDAISEMLQGHFSES